MSLLDKLKSSCMHREVNYLIIIHQLNVKTHLKPIETAQWFFVFFFFTKTGKMVSQRNMFELTLCMGNMKGKHSGM